MNTLNSLSLTLFESTNANFRLTTNVMFNKENSQTKAKYPLIKVTQSGNAKCEPSTFLVFTYTEGSFESDVSVYTSNPHLLKIRSILEEMKNAFLSNQAFIQTNTGLVVSERYADVYSIGNIGAQSKWIAFRFVADAIVDNTNNHIPAVEITLSNAPKACILTIDEFLSIYTIIQDISLPQMALLASVAALNSRNTVVSEQPRNNYNPAPRQNVGNNYGGYNSQPPRSYTQNSNGGFATRGQNVQPVENDDETPMTTVRPNYQNNTSFVPPKKSNVSTMQPRSASPIQSQPKTTASMKNIEAIENIPVDDFELGEEGLSDLFDGE